jgi:hypothetical protein
MGELRVVETRPAVVHKSVVETIEAVLAEAKEGRIVAVALAVVRPDMATNRSWSETDCLPALIGGTAILMQQMMKAADE